MPFSIDPIGELPKTMHQLRTSKHFKFFVHLRMFPMPLDARRSTLNKQNFALTESPSWSKQNPLKKNLEFMKHPSPIGIYVWDIY